MNVEVGDANMLGDCYKQFGRFECHFLRNPAPGEITSITVPSGFYWRIEPVGTLLVYPGWWRRLIYAVTGRWSLC